MAYQKISHKINYSDLFSHLKNEVLISGFVGKKMLITPLYSSHVFQTKDQLNHVVQAIEKQKFTYKYSISIAFLVKVDPD